VIDDSMMIHAAQCSCSIIIGFIDSTREIHAASIFYNILFKLFTFLVNNLFGLFGL